ncbi:MAG: efflux RND transporter permease subunit [Chloroflexota bacterium]|jgi:HAE1 family hydrophobic/amphiphilic exporter-1
MIRLTRFSLRQQSVVILLAISVFIAGAYSWTTLKQELIPDIELPFVLVISPMPGAGAETVAGQVTEPLEQALVNVPRLEGRQSSSSNSMSMIFAEFDFGTDVKQAVDDVERAIGSATLPEDVDPTVVSFSIDQMPVVTATIGAAEGADPAVAAEIARHEILPRLQGIDGVSTAELTGGSTPALDIVLDPAAMAEHGVSLQQVQGILYANQITLPSGSITEADLRLPVSTVHDYISTAQLEAQIVGASGGAGASAGMGGSSGAAAPTANQSPDDASTAEAAGETAGDEPSDESTAGGLFGQLSDLSQLTEALAAMPVPVTLGDIATVVERDAFLSGYARTNGQPSLTVSVSQASGANTVEVSSEIEQVFEEAREAYPDILLIETITDQADYINESVEGLLQEGLLGGLFAVLVIFLFLRSVRTTAVAAISIPLSLFIAIAIFGLFDLTINILTLSGLTVAVGRVIDDSIVVLENIYRHKGLGDDTGEAVVNGTKEVAAAITTSTVTTVAIFLPIGFVGGLVSQFFLPFALAVTFAMLASLLVALTVIPVLAYLFVDKVKIELDEHGEPPETIWQRIYTPILQLALRSRGTKWATLGIAAVLSVGAMVLAAGLPTAFIDMGGENLVTITVAPPQGGSSEAVRARAIEAEDILLARKDVEMVMSTIPGDADTGMQALQASFAGRAPNSALMTVRVDDAADMEETRQQIKTDLGTLSTDGFEVIVSGESQMAAGMSGMSIVVSGPDPDEIKAASDLIAVELARMEGLDNVASDAVAEAPQVRVAVDSNMAMMIGSTTAQVGTEIRGVLVGSPLGTYTLEDGTTRDATLRVSDVDVDSVESLRQMPVSGMAGSAPLGRVAEVEVIEVRSTVTRVNGSPAATVSAEIITADTGSASQEAAERIEALRAEGLIPETIETAFAGVTAEMDEAFESLFFSMGFAIVVVYIVMVLALGSLLTPFIILFSLPLAAIGAFPALYLSGHPLGISAMVGLLMLIGIVVTNAIVLLDFVEQRRARGDGVYDALIGGGRVRVRPILMTAIATMLALTPVAMGMAHGSVIAEELAVVVIGGLFSSTALTLIVIPVLYSLVEGGKAGFRERFMGGAEGQPAAEGPAPTPPPEAPVPAGD